MHFRFFDIVALEVDNDLRALTEFFYKEFLDFAESPGPCPYRIELRPMRRTKTEDGAWDASVGDMMYRRGEAYYLADRWGRKAEWFQPKLPADTVCLEVDPEFTPYRVYYYLVLPLLKWFLNQRRMTFLHSSAVAIRGHRIALSGWGGTGKTNTLLGLIQQGGEYLADDLVVADDRGNLYPFPRTLNIYHYNVEAVPELEQLLTRGQRIRVRALSVVGEALVSLVPRLRAVVSILQKHFSNAHIPSARVNPVANRPVGAPAALFVLLYRAPADREAETLVQPNPSGVANACLANLAFEMRPIQDCYAMYAFLSGREMQTVVQAVDRQIIGDFLRATRIKGLMVPAGARVEGTIISLAEAVYGSEMATTSHLQDQVGASPWGGNDP